MCVPAGDRGLSVQEIFQAVTENFYAADATQIAPMILIGIDYWTTAYPAWPLLERLGDGCWKRSFIASTTWPTQSDSSVEHGIAMLRCDAGPFIDSCQLAARTLPAGGRILDLLPGLGAAPTREEGTDT